MCPDVICVFGWVGCLMVVLFFLLLVLYLLGGDSYSNFCGVWFNRVWDVWGARSPSISIPTWHVSRISQFVQTALTVSGIRDEFLFKKADVSCDHDVFPLFPKAGSCFGFGRRKTISKHIKGMQKCHHSCRSSLIPINHTGPLPSGGSNDGGGVLSNFSSFRPEFLWKVW